MFIDGSELDRHFETAEGIIWVSGLVQVRAATVFFHRLLIYPTTGARLDIGVRPMLDILSSLKQEAIAQGLAAYSIEAERMYKDKPQRIIHINRRLR